jgi:hypothetical protein
MRNAPTTYAQELNSAQEIAKEDANTGMTESQRQFRRHKEAYDRLAAMGALIGDLYSTAPQPTTKRFRSLSPSNVDSEDTPKRPKEHKPDYVR